MEIEQYVCPNCMVKLRKSIWEEVYSNNINGNLVKTYEGVCKNCRKKFTFFVDNIYDKAVFWTKDDEKIFSDLIDFKSFGTIKILYSIKENFKEVVERYEKIRDCSLSVIITLKKNSDVINKLDLKKNNKIIFIDEDILSTRFEYNYPCILAEKNILETTKKFRKFKLYSGEKTYYKFFEYIGEKNG